VVSSLDGRPLEQARVLIVDTGDRTNAAAMVTEASGHFEFNVPKRGKFALNGAKRGFLPGAYEQHERHSTAIVTGKGLDTEHLLLRLTPLAVIAGKVLNEVGDAVRNAPVSLFAESHAGGMNRIVRFSTTTSDDQGTYEFPGLAPGNYFVSATARPWYAVHPAGSGETGGSSPDIDRTLDVAYPTTYYGGATEPEGAAPIEVKGGDHAQADVHLSPVPALRIVFRIPEGDQATGATTPMFRKRAFENNEVIQMEMQCISHPPSCEISGIPAGRYQVEFRDPRSAQITSTEMDLTRDGQELDTTRGEPSATVRVSVKMARGENLPKPLLLALLDKKQRVVAFRQVDTSGAVIFEGVRAGKYSLDANSSGRSYSTIRIASGGTELSSAELTIGSGAALDATVTLVAGVVTIEGFAKHSEKAIAGAMVVLVPKDPESHLQMFRRDQSDLDGSFLIRDVVPGTYTIVAVQDAWDFPWLEPGVFSRYVLHGQDLTIGEALRGALHLPNPVEVQPR